MDSGGRALTELGSEGQKEEQGETERENKNREKE